MVAARVAGVPRPLPAIASRSSSSSISLPAPSMADSNVASVKRAGGFVTRPLALTLSVWTFSPLATGTRLPLPLLSLSASVDASLP
ncbi:hypothetical protein D3C72_1640670 [compost metagenome]